MGNAEISNANMIMYEILSGHSNSYTKYNETLLPITINYLCTDGHHAYNEVFNKYKNNIKHHIVSKSETCLVECFNASMRDRLARLKRKSKAYSKDINMLKISLNMWMNSNTIFSNINKYCGYR